MSHIAIDARIINSSTGRYVERLLHYLQEVDTVNRYSVLLLAKDKDYFTPTAENFHIEIADFEQYSVAEQLGFKKLLDDLAPDLVHFCMPQQPVLYRGAKVTTFHDLTLLNTYNSDKNWLIFHFKQFVGKFVFKSVAKSSAYILTPSEFTKTALVDFAGIDPEKVIVTYEAADIFDDKIASYDLPFKEYLLYVGQQPDYKNLRRLADAHQRLIKKYPDLGLVLVGKLAGDTLANKELFESKGYKNIVFTGFLPDEQRDWLYKHTSAYVFPSLMEGFGLPGLEAMSYGVPVVSSNATCLPEVYEHAAHYFNPNDTTDMARAINDVLSDESLKKDLVVKGYTQIKKYSWRRMAEQTHATYIEALATTNLPEQL
jgi:glycosyltransferase involved in cell wall biosynthesis